MLIRVSCRACRLSSIWTDDPGAFLQTVCLRYQNCQAELLAEADVPAKEVRHQKPGRASPMTIERAARSRAS